MLAGEPSYGAISEAHRKKKKNGRRKLLIPWNQIRDIPIPVPFPVR
jgi:hypothetical protein